MRLSPLIPVFISHSEARSVLLGEARKPKDFCTSRPILASSKVPSGLFFSALIIAPLIIVTKTKSLKCPACKAASCRLSVNERSFRECSAIVELGEFIQRKTVDNRIVVAELRLSALKEANLFMSLAEVVFTSPQDGQNLYFPFKYQVCLDPACALPSG